MTLTPDAMAKEEEGPSWIGLTERHHIEGGIFS